MRGDRVIGCFEFLYVAGGYENFLRELFIIDPDSTLRQITVNDLVVGRMVH